MNGTLLLNTLMAVDPGGTTGWVLYDIPSQKPLEMGETKEDKLNEWLAGYQSDVDVWVVEDYFIRPAHMQKGFAHQWDKGTTHRILGKIEYAAFLHGAEFHLQQPSVKVMGYKRLGMEYKKGKKGMHIQDALAHGKLFLEKEYGVL